MRLKATKDHNVRIGEYQRFTRGDDDNEQQVLQIVAPAG